MKPQKKPVAIVVGILVAVIAIVLLASSLDIIDIRL